MAVYLYWDASGLVKRYALERGSNIVNIMFDRVPVSQMMCLLLAMGEVSWIFVRKRNDGRITHERYRQANSEFRSEVIEDGEFAKLPVEEDLVLASLDMIARYSLNSTDALVLRSALDMKELVEDDETKLVLIAADDRLLRAAQAEGLTVLNPEAAQVTDVEALVAPTQKEQEQ